MFGDSIPPANKTRRPPERGKHLYERERCCSGPLNTEAAITLEQDKEGFRVSLSALTLRASVANLDQGAFDRLAQDAEQNCPVSRVLRAEITPDAKRVERRSVNLS
jgi:organic hydroperoxide reductase OsmC/OhrA